MWTIWYSTGETSGSTFDEWITAPDTEVLAVYRLIEKKDTYSVGHVCMGSDWYWMEPDGTTGESLKTSDAQGSWTVNTAPAGARSKSGIWTSDERMQQVHDAIKTLIET